MIITESCIDIPGEATEYDMIESSCFLKFRKSYHGRLFRLKLSRPKNGISQNRANVDPALEQGTRLWKFFSVRTVKFLLGSSGVHGIQDTQPVPNTHPGLSDSCQSPLELLICKVTRQNYQTISMKKARDEGVVVSGKFQTRRAYFIMQLRK